MIRPARCLCIASGMVLTLVAAPLALGATTIADLAPPNSVFVAGVDDFASMQASFDKTGLRKVWDDPAVQAWIKKHSAEAMEECDTTLAALDLTREAIVPPTSLAGLEVW